MSAIADIAAAIDATRGMGTARVHNPSQRDGPTGERARGLRGVADLARCRVSLADGALVWDGDRHLGRVADEERVTRLGRGLHEFEHHPLWMLLGGVRWRAARELGPADVDGLEVRRLGAQVEPPRRPFRRKRANAELWLDQSGIIRVASIQIQPVAIPWDEDMARKVERLVGTPDNPLWNTTELSDFGVAAEIPALAPDSRRFRRRSERASR